MELTHWGWNKLASVLQIIILNTSSCKKICVIGSKFHFLAVSIHNATRRHWPQWVKSISWIRNSQQMYPASVWCRNLLAHFAIVCRFFIFGQCIFLMFQMITRISSNLQHLPQVSPDLYCLQMSLVIATLKMISTTRHHQRILHQQAMTPYQEEETWWNLR